MPPTPTRSPSVGASGNEPSLRRSIAAFTRWPHWYFGSLGSIMVLARSWCGHLGQRQVLEFVACIDRIELLALHADSVAAFEKLDAIDVELLQEGADGDDVANLALLGQDVADLLAGIRAVVADGTLGADLLAKAEERWATQFDHVAVANNIAHAPLLIGRSGLTATRARATSWTMLSGSSVRPASSPAVIRLATS